MIDLSYNEEQVAASAKRCAERGIVIPTFAQMRDPSLIPDSIRAQLKTVGLWDVDPRNLFRVTWKNEPVASGGLYGDVNYLELPEQLTGSRARIVALVGKWFPTGAHKVGATFGCIVPRLVTGQFDPMRHKAVWPSTGNYCRGGAYIAALLACESVAILPEEMSAERFEWLSSVAGEVIATPGCESNVKEIFDKCWELRAERDDIMIFNQFEEFGNHLWHYEVTGPAMGEVIEAVSDRSSRVAAIALSSGSAGTLGSADYIKTRYPACRIAVAEALQCPTLLENGFGGHRIEGIGDKHVPWIHNVRNTDLVIAVDDEVTVRAMRLFNEPIGRSLLEEEGVAPEFVGRLDLLGISSIANVIAAVKLAHYYELGPEDIVLTVLTDSMELYQSRIAELSAAGEYTTHQAARDYEAVLGTTTDSMLELRYPDRRRIHNLKYYTWIEQQGRELDELNRQWYDAERYWNHDGIADKLDELITAFNGMVARS
jgi:cysteine synthase A